MTKNELQKEKKEIVELKDTAKVYREKNLLNVYRIFFSNFLLKIAFWGGWVKSNI